MADQIDKSPNFSLSDLREVTLRIPGEHFFCESLSLPASLKGLSKGKKDPLEFERMIQDFVAELLSDSSFSPYPAEQLAWGYHYCSNAGKILVFATPISKLGKLGWENLDLFRRVFPSFISLLGTTYDKPSIAFFICDETLTAAAFIPGSTVPERIYSLSFDPESEESFSKTRSKLLTLTNSENYETADVTLVAGEVLRNPDGFFEFDHHFKGKNDSSFQLAESVRMSAEELWNQDIRSPVFKAIEKTKRLKQRALWRALKVSSIFFIILLICFTGMEIFNLKNEAESEIARNMAKEVPLVLESQKLLEKLKQNKLGGIDPFGAIARLTVHRGGTVDRPSLWFSKAHFETRNHVKLEGEGVNVESVNTFISNIENNGVAQIRKGRGGDEIRQIKSDGGKTTFEVEINLLEEVVPETDKPQSILGE